MAVEDPQKPQFRLTRSIVLVGLMGAGKSSVGRRLAEVLAVPFTDADHEIEVAAGLKVSEIFERFGEVYFRDGERRVMERIMAGTPCVLATGGGAFIDPATRALILRDARSVWLNAEIEVLWDRVKDRNTRPLLQVENPRQVLADLLADRAPTYAMADIAVTSERGLSHDNMAKRVLEAVMQHDRENETGRVLEEVIE